ncbi:MAG: GTP-binding protein [Bacilli bacterium]|nr:GTP-binding protein [Bacilli bacterium]
MNTRIYIFNGFLDSGKTTFLQDTVLNTDFCDDEKTVIVVSEEGEIEYKQEEIESRNCDLVYIDSEEDFTYEFFDNLKEKYNPTQVLIELNGMYMINRILAASKPEGWDVVQVLTTINAQTFNLYVNNMRSLVYNQVVHSDLVIFNRVDDSMKKSFLRNTVKAINGSVQIIYEKEDGTVNTLEDDELPFDTSSSYLEIADHDFGLFCMDMIDHPETYHHKTIKLRGKFIGLDKQIPNGFILGREAMVCCADDTSLVGMVCVHQSAKQFIPNEWLELEGLVELKYDSDVGGDICILYVTDIKVIQPLENEYVTFD